MIESWLMELLKGLGRFFLNPVLYWTVILVMLTGYKRVKQERKHFGFKVFDVFSEWHQTWPVSVLFGLVVSIVAIGSGTVLSAATIGLLAVVTIALSLPRRLTMLSPVYTIGITFLLLLAAPFLLAHQSVLDQSLFAATNLGGLGLLLAVLLAAEAFLLHRETREKTFPALARSRRGTWIGVHHLKRMTIIPFFVLIPTDSMPGIVPSWLDVSINDETYSLVLIPFLLGYDRIVRSDVPEKVAARLAKPIYLLSLIVVVLAISGIYVGWLSLAAVVTGVIGRELIYYKHRINDQAKAPFFHRRNRGMQVLAVIPATPAARLGIQPGEVIIAVNGQSIDSIEEFYHALQESAAFFKLSVIGDNGEVRFVQSALYEEDHYELGILTIDEPYQGDKLA